MTTKERVLRVIQALPENATVADAIAELRRFERASGAEPVVKPEQSVPEGIPGGDAWELLRSLTGALQMPPDWASEHDHYLYGSPKRFVT